MPSVRASLKPKAYMQINTTKGVEHMSQPTRDLDLLHPLVQLNTEMFIAYCKGKGYNVEISETYRSEERQDALYAQGRTTAGMIVTYAKGSDKSSYHQWGLAVDFFQNIKDEEYEQNFMEEVGVIAEMFGFEWGGRWTKFKDTCHLQMTFGLSIADLRYGKTVEDVLPSAYVDAVIRLVEKKELLQPGLWLNMSMIRPTHIQALVQKFASKA